MRNAGAKIMNCIQKKFSICKITLSLEVFADDNKSMLEQGKKLIPGPKMFM